MTISLSTDPGGLFVRLGLIGGQIAAVNSARGATLVSAADDLQAQYLSQEQLAIDSLYTQVDAFRTAQNGWLTALKQFAGDTLVEQVYRDAKINPKTVEVALRELIRQMVAGSESVDAPTVSASVATGSANIGTGTVLVSVTGPDGIQLDNCFAETLTVTCTNDAITGDATARQETFSAVGDFRQDDTLSWDWPVGSGAAIDLTVVDASEDAGTQVLTNGDFEDFTVANTPDQWSIILGTPGTTIFDGTSSAYRGSHCLKITGTAGAELTSLAQVLNTSGTGSVGELSPLTTYCVTGLAKVDSVPAAGVLRVSLVNGSNTIIADAASTNNTFNIDCTALTTGWTRFSGFFRTPSVLPSSGYKLRLDMTTAITNTKSVLIDDLVLTAGTQLYPGGPYAVVVAGLTDFIAKDVFTLTVSNNFAGGFVVLFERLFGMRQLNLQLPHHTGGSETIDDALIA